MADRRRNGLTAMLLLAAAIVLLLAYVPILRVHQAWEDEVFWFSTCLSLARHQAPVPAVLADFPGTHTPLRFYGPTLFWCGEIVLKLFGSTMRAWRSFSFAGDVAFIAAIALLFRKVRGTWLAAATAAFVFSLSVNISLWLSLPGRVDAWTLTFIVLAILAVASPADTQQPVDREALARRWSIFGCLLGIAASTTPRCWPLLLVLTVVASFSMMTREDRLHSLSLAGAWAATALAILLLPLGVTPWEHVVSIRHASTNDPVNTGPLLHGVWSLGHATTQIAYYTGVLVVIALTYARRPAMSWRRNTQLSLARWLTLAGLSNLALMIAAVARAISTPTFWAFPLEIVALLGLMQPIASRETQGLLRMRWARGLGVMLLAYMAALRVARELPAYAHWRQRDPVEIARAVTAAVPAGSIVYGPIAEYAYAVLEDSSEYRYLIERTTPGLTSLPGQLDRPSPMLDACRRPAYLIWPAGKEGEPLPALPHATLTEMQRRRVTPQNEGRLERMIERVPAGRSEPDEQSFSVYRVELDRAYCSQALEQ